jgi:hypothetical protein
MKVLAALSLITFTLSLAVAAQDSKVIAEIAASSEKVVKNSPFSADAVSESVQTLADGNRIVRNSTTKLHRNSEGRFRRELKSGSGSVLGSSFSFGSGVTILDPVAGHRYLLDPNLKTVRQGLLRAPLAVRQKGEVAVGEGPTPAPDKVRTEIKVAAPIELAVVPGLYTTVAPSATGTGGVHVYSTSAKSNYDSRTEDLGTRNIEGVDAEGTRTTTTIPADAIGNERPIEIVYERWHSKELDLIVLSKHSDPRFGEQTYRLTNIVRSEPDPSLFTPPQGYKLITEPGSRTYTINARNAIAVEKAAAAKAAQEAATITKTKP